MRRWWSLIALVVAIAPWGRTWGADTNCGGQACEEATLCARSDILLCSDFNNLDDDGWAAAYETSRGDILTSIGRSGTGGLQFNITDGEHGSQFWEQGISGVGFGPLYVRFYVRFSPGYLFAYPGTCDLQKLFYLESYEATFWRIMVGSTRANCLAGGEFSGEPNTTGLIMWDHDGHVIQWPDQGGDTPMPIFPNTWYAVEIFVHYVSATQNTVTLWINGAQQMTRSNYDDPFWNNHDFNALAPDAYHGGSGSIYLPTQNQNMYIDNVVVGTSYIGPIAAASDTENPSTPTWISATATSSSTIALSWNASTDNIGVTGYEVFRNGGGTPIASPGGTTYTDTTVVAETLYTYTLKAVDAAGNRSALSAEIQETTPAGPAGGLEVAYTLNETSGQALADCSGNARNAVRGTTSGAEASDPTPTTGQFNSALSFDGADVVTGPSYTLQETFTLSGWLFNAAASGIETLISVGGTRSLYLSAGVMRFWDVAAVEFGGAALPTGQWVHIAVTYDGTNIRAYLDGVLYGSPQAETYADATGGILLAQYPGGADYLTGVLDDIRIYNRALSSSEILADMAIEACAAGDVTAPAAPTNLRVVRP